MTVVARRNKRRTPNKIVILSEAKDLLFFGQAAVSLGSFDWTALCKRDASGFGGLPHLLASSFGSSPTRSTPAARAVSITSATNSKFT